jgi:hypothetical protein
MKHRLPPFALAAFFLVFGVVAGLRGMGHGDAARTVIVLASGVIAGASLARALADPRRPA